MCGNSDYTVKFDFDAEWAGEKTKTARFVWNGGYTDVIFKGDTVNMPPITNTCVVAVGVFAGDLRTTTPALVSAYKSISCMQCEPMNVPDNAYQQLLKAYDDISKRISVLEKGGASPEQIAAAVAEYFKTNGTNVIDENSDDEHFPSAKAVYDFVDGSTPIKYLESLDKENIMSMRDIENGYYVMTGYFCPYPNCDTTVIMDTMYVSVARLNAGSHLMSISPLNFRITCYEILVDETAEDGFTFQSWRVNLLDLLNRSNALVTAIDENSDDEHYPSAKAVYDLIGAMGESVPLPATAEVGQTVVVSAVDKDGKPTAWKTEKQVTVQDVINALPIYEGEVEDV